MGLFNFKKKKNQPVLSIKWVQTKVTQDEGLQHLTKEGELPFGWIYRNKEFTDNSENVSVGTNFDF
jgi:hypothetical protein